MNPNLLHHYIQSLLPVSDATLPLLSEQFEYVEFEKNDFLFEENKVSQYTYFLESGFVRSFIWDKDGNEVTINIFSAPRFVNDFLSFFKQQPSKENFQCLTSCKMWRATFEQTQYLFHNFPEFREFGRMMLITNYSQLNDRMLGMIQDAAEIRYAKLLAQSPTIFQNVPLKIIASYLGITDTSLSRIRKEITKK